MDAERTPPGAWRVEGFTLDLARGALLADRGAEVAMRPKSFACRSVAMPPHRRCRRWNRPRQRPAPSAGSPRS
jgi:hypothetical protein